MGFYNTGTLAQNADFGFSSYTATDAKTFASDGSNANIQALHDAISLSGWRYYHYPYRELFSGLSGITLQKASHFKAIQLLAEIILHGTLLLLPVVNETMLVIDNIAKSQNWFNKCLGSWLSIWKNYRNNV